MRPNLHRASARSYTLIELIMVMAVLALAAALLIPNLVGLDSMNAQAAGRMLLSDLSFAPSDALANQGLRRVVFLEDGSGYCILDVPSENWTTPLDLNDPSVEYVLDPLHTMGRYIVDYTLDTRFQGVSVTSALVDGVALADRPEITYDELGGTIVPGGGPGIGGNVVITYDGSSYQINIATFTGKLTVMEL